MSRWRSTIFQRRMRWKDPRKIEVDVDVGAVEAGRIERVYGLRESMVSSILKAISKLPVLHSRLRSSVR